MKISNLSKGKMHRRSFLQYSGAGLAFGGLVAAACNDGVYKQGTDGMTDGAYMGSGDIAILNYAYALEQLEAAFYTQVIESPYSGINDMERGLLTDIRDHEIAHREFFKAALGDAALPDLEVNFSSINFSSRDSVIGAAKTFEDLGVAAYNGAGQLIEDVRYLALAGKIVSVEARHAAYIRDLVSNGSFANSEVVDSNGLEKSMSPSNVLTAAAPFIVTKIDARDLPTY